MKKLIVFLLALTVLLSACVSSSGVCVEDNVCSLDEKFKGGCYDCQADLDVSYVSAYNYNDYNNGELKTNVYAVVKNNGAELSESFVKATFTIVTDSDTYTQTVNQELWSSDDILRGDADFSADQGTFNFNFDLAENDETYWIYADFDNLELEGEMTISVSLEYEDRDESNNEYSDTFYYGVISASNYLIEKDIGVNLFTGSSKSSYEYTYNGEFYSYEDYSASYQDTIEWTQNTTSHYVYVSKLQNYEDAETMYGPDSWYETSGYHEKVMVDGNAVYAYTSPYNDYVTEPTSYEWMSGDVRVYLYGDYRKGVDKAVLIAYLDKYPSDLEADEVEDAVFDFKLVIGDNAASSRVILAVDVSTNVQSQFSFFEESDDGLNPIGVGTTVLRSELNISALDSDDVLFDIPDLAGDVIYVYISDNAPTEVVTQVTDTISELESVFTNESFSVALHSDLEAQPVPLNTPLEFVDVEDTYYIDLDPSYGDYSFELDLSGLISDTTGDGITFELTGLDNSECGVSSGTLQCTLYGDCGSATVSASDGETSIEQQFYFCKSSISE